MQEKETGSRLQQLMDAHPALFHGEPPKVFSHLPAGWYQIMDRLCTDLERLLGPRTANFEWGQIKEKFGSLRAYWGLDEVTPLHADVLGASPKHHLEDDPDWQVETAKTPVGFALTLLPHGDLHSAIHARVREAENESERTCFECGESGELWSDGWLHTACDAHHKPGAVKLRAMEGPTHERGSDV